MARDSFVLISYVPLLRGRPGMAVEATPGAIGELLGSSEPGAGQVEGVLWCRDPDGATWPTLLIERAREVMEHLVEWAEGDPARWFRLVVDEAGREYAMALMPRMDLSIERYRAARRLVAGDAGPEWVPARVMSQPLVFRGPKSSISDGALAAMPDEVRVGFLPSVAAAEPGTANLGAIPSVGPLQVVRGDGSLLRGATD